MSKTGKVKDLSVQMKKDEKSGIFDFSLFSFNNLDEDIFLLLSNKDKGKILSGKYKNIDFFLIINSESVQIQEISKKITKSDFINGSFILQTDNVLKKIMNKLFEDL